jgi:hypothetical protein
VTSEQHAICGRTQYSTPIDTLEPARRVERIFTALAGEAAEPERVMIDTTHLKAHRTAASLLQKGVLRAASVAPKAA